jgi:hypothetical protein
MNIREISDVFKDTANQITAIKSYNFGWPSDRTRSSNTEDYQELNEFPRVFFSVPTITGSDQTRKQDTYQVTIFFDDLLGYNNEGDADLTLQLDKWATLQVYATAFIQRLNLIKQSILPNYIFIPDAPAMTFDSFTGLQRMITVQLSFTLVVPTNCEPIVSKLVECIANIVTSSNLTAALKNIFELVSSLQASSSLSANLQLTKFAASSLNANASLNASALVSKLAASSLTGAGTLVADLTVTALANLLLDLYPNAAAAYSLRKLRTAYTGSAIRVRRSSDNTEQDIGFVNNVLDESALTTFCGAGNGFVTTWYDQSGSARNAIQTTAANQPQIVSSGIVITRFGKPYIEATTTRFFILSPTISINIPDSFSFWMTYEKDNTSNGNAILLESGSSYMWLENFSSQQISTLGAPIVISPSIAANTTYLINVNTNYTVGANIFTNNTFRGSRSALTSASKSAFLPSNSFRAGKITFNEFVLYSFNQETNRIPITNNINAYYAIY